MKSEGRQEAGAWGIVSSVSHGGHSCEDSQGGTLGSPTASKRDGENWRYL